MHTDLLHQLNDLLPPTGAASADKYEETHRMPRLVLKSRLGKLLELEKLRRDVANLKLWLLLLAISHATLIVCLYLILK